MRFPALSQLDQDQKAIYTGASPQVSILVKGPPGTGKTVMAFHRAAVLARLEMIPQVIMFNTVLAQYAAGANGSPVDGALVSTMHKWLYHWWNRILGKRGASPPTIPNNAYAPDWHSILETTLSRLKAGSVAPSAVSWTHLIVDEGQDFPSDMYRVLNLLSMHLGMLDVPTPAVSVFADENQRLQPGNNSTLNEIQVALGLTEQSGRVYTLRKNYRNSRPIAEFASKFYVGLQTGIPDLPEKRGPKPKVSRASGIEAVRAHLAKYAINNAGREVGILCSTDKLRKQLFNSLSSRLGEYELQVQTYSSKDKEKYPATDLSFDEGDVLTVLNFQSAKGLEFDTVFIVDPFSAFSMGGSGEQHFKMQMYVMCSRARDHLEVILLEHPSTGDIMPPPQLYDYHELG